MSTNRSSRQRRRPLPPGQTLYTPAASPARRAVEQRSAAPMVFLHQLPAWLLPLVAVALLITGLAVGGVIGAVALCAVALILGWLAAVSWPRLGAAGRLGRIAAVALVLALAVFRVAH